MSFRHTARHLSVRSRMARRRIRQVLARTGTGTVLGPASALCAGVSVVAHLLVTWGVVSFVPAQLPDAANDPLLSSRFLYPLMQQRPRPQVERISYVGLGGRIVESAPATKKVGVTTGATEAMATVSEPPQSEESEPFEAFSELEVDVAAERAADSEGPSYPDSLLTRQVEGETRVRFVIDSTGRAIEESFGVIETTHLGFAEAVLQALPRMRFKPATMGRKSVAQRVEQTFVFKITRPPIVP